MQLSPEEFRGGGKENYYEKDGTLFVRGHIGLWAYGLRRRSGERRFFGQQTESSVADESQGSSESENVESSVADDGQADAEGWSEEMAGLRAAVVDAVGQDEYWPDMPMDGEMLNMLYGITSDMYDDYMAESPMISTNVDTLVIVKAKTDQVDTVFDLMTAYREKLVNDTMQYPSNLGKIQSSQVEKVGDYVIFVQLGGMAGMADSEEEAIKQSQEANAKALEAIKGKLE